MSRGVHNPGKGRSSDGWGRDDGRSWYMSGRVGHGVSWSGGDVMNGWGSGVRHMLNWGGNSVLLNGGITPAGGRSGNDGRVADGGMDWSGVGDGGVTESWSGVGDGGITESWSDDTSLSSGSGLGVSSGVLNLGVVNFDGVSRAGEGDGRSNGKGVGSNSVSVVVSDVMRGEWDSLSADVGEDSSDSTGSISDSSVALAGLRVAKDSLSKFVLRVVLSLGGSYNGGSSNNWGGSNGGVSKTWVGITETCSIAEAMGVTESLNSVVDDLCRTDCQDGSENGNDLHYVG